MPSIAKTTVEKNSGMCAMVPTHGRDAISGSGTAASTASLLENGLTPSTTHVMEQPKPTSMNVVATAEKGTKTRSERMMPRGRIGKARHKIQVRME